jgi:polyribonucleotide nucleotidyltransferase
MSQLAPERVKQTTDVVKEGDKVWVKLLGFDDRGKVRLQRHEDGRSGNAWTYEASRRKS